jgi:hypothetical protein
MKTWLVLSAVASILSVSTAQAEPNLVQDGLFLTSTTGMNYGVGDNAYWSDVGTYSGGTLRGWSEPSTPFFSNGNAPSYAGAPADPYHFMYMDAGVGYQTYAFTQTITGLTPGATYDLSFLANYFTENNVSGDTVQWIANLGGTATFNGPGGNFSGFTGGETQATPVATIPQGTGGVNGTGWISQVLTFTAQSPSEALTFLAAGSGDPPFAAITNISLSDPAPAPEPAAWCLMGLGVFGLGSILRLRRRAQPA